jgi:hypothetical protein
MSKLVTDFLFLYWEYAEIDAVQQNVANYSLVASPFVFQFVFM